MKKGLTLFFLLVFLSPAYAHFLWLNVDDYTPAPGQEIRITLGWGHQFPQTPVPPRAEMVRRISLFLIDPRGRKIPLSIPLKEGKPQPVRVRLHQKGVYLVVAMARHFVSKTTEGYFYRSRLELKDKEVLYSKWSETTAIALISVGRSRKIPVSGLDSNFYLLPLENPSLVQEGEIFRVRVVFKGKPCRTWVYATYAGFSPFKDTYAWTIRTDHQGLAPIKVLRRGPSWLLRSEFTEPYPDPRKADMADYKCTVTFGF